MHLANVKCHFSMSKEPLWVCKRATLGMQKSHFYTRKDTQEDSVTDICSTPGSKVAQIFINTKQKSDVTR